MNGETIWAELCLKGKNGNGKFGEHMQIFLFYAPLCICALKISEGI